MVETPQRYTKNVSKVVCNGETTSVNFATSNTGTTTYNWSSDIAIGMPALTGTGSIPNFAAINSGNSPIVATITVTPTYTNNGISCVGLPKTFTITVNPSADVIQPVTPLILCNGTPTSVNFTTINTGGLTTYSWTNNTTSIGLGASGTGTINSFFGVNTGLSPVVGTITVTPTYTSGSVSCVGSAKQFTIQVNNLQVKTFDHANADILHIRGIESVVSIIGDRHSESFHDYDITQQDAKGDRLRNQQRHGNHHDR